MDLFFLYRLERHLNMLYLLRLILFFHDFFAATAFKISGLSAHSLITDESCLVCNRQPTGCLLPATGYWLLPLQKN